MVCGKIDHFTKYFTRLKEVQQYVKDRPNQTVVLTNPFHSQQQQQAIAQSPAPPLGNNAVHLPQGACEIHMLNTINIHTHTNTYDSLLDKSIEKEPPPSQLNGFLHIDNPPLT